MTIPYHLTKTEKCPLLLEKLNALTKWHIEKVLSIVR